MALILALDQGTTSSRAIVFGEDGSPQGIGQEALTQIYPEPGWVEHDPREILASQLACARKAMADAGVTSADIKAIGITNQRETSVIWDRKTGEPIHNALVWQDRRCAPWCEAQARAGHLDLVKARTGLVLDPYFSAGKIAWLLEHVDSARTRAMRGELAFGTIDSWLIWNLSGGLHVTDITNASRTLLFDIHRCQWDEELLERFDIPAALLPEVRGSAGDFGDARHELLGTALPIRGVAGDQQAALFGQGCVKAGQVKNTYGTGCFMLMHTGQDARESDHGLLTTLAAGAAGSGGFALEGSVFSAGSAVQWLRDELGLITDAAGIEALARSVQDTGGLTLVPAFTGLGSPYWDAHARGALLGITRGTNRAHIARAALEAIALQSAELLEAMRNDSDLAVTELRVDGGAAANDLLMQMQADLLQVPVVRPAVGETTAQGAADLALLGAQVFQKSEDLRLARAKNAAETTFYPQATPAWAEERMSSWRAAIGRVLTRQR